MSQYQIETTLVTTLKRMAIRRKGSLGKPKSLHVGKAEMKLMRMGYDGSTARRIVEDCEDVALNEARIELGI